MITLDEAVEDFLLAKRAGQRSAKTTQWYATYLKPFQSEHGDAALNTITMRPVARFLIAQVGAEHTRFNRDRVLRLFFKWAGEMYNVPDPMAGIPVPRLPDLEPKAIEKDTLNALLAACTNARDTAILTTLADCGLRASGVIGMSIDDLDFAHRALLVREKRGRVRAVPFSLETEKALLRWCKVRPLAAEKLFCTDVGGDLTYSGLRQILRRLSVRAGMAGERCNIHSLRHFAAREYLRQGGTLPALARILGHKSIDTTVRYYAVFSDSELAEVHDSHSPLNSLKERDMV
jgi:integrase/recombinase XerD